MDQQSKINAAIDGAREYLGVKWRHRGRSKFGIDCIGLVVHAMAAAGVVMRDRIDYGRTPHQDGLEKDIHAHFGEPVDGLLPGDVVLMCWDGEDEPSHVGIIGGDHEGLTLIHSYSLVTVVEHGIDEHWARRIIRVYRPFR